MPKISIEGSLKETRKGKRPRPEDHTSCALSFLLLVIQGFHSRKLSILEFTYPHIDKHQKLREHFNCHPALEGPKGS